MDSRLRGNDGVAEERLRSNVVRANQLLGLPSMDSRLRGNDGVAEERLRSNVVRGNQLLGLPLNGFPPARE